MSIAATDRPRLTWEDLSPRIKGHTGPTADAADSFSDAVMYLLAALYGEDTGRPAEVVETIGEALDVLHTIRAECVQEARWRIDAAMERSGMNVEALTDKLSTLTGDEQTTAMSDELSQVGDYCTDAIVELARKGPGAHWGTADAMQGLVYALDRISALRGALDRIRFDEAGHDQEGAR